MLKPFDQLGIFHARIEQLANERVTNRQILGQGFQQGWE